MAITRNEVNKIAEFVDFYLEKKYEGMTIRPGIGDVARATEHILKVFDEHDIDVENAVILEVCRRRGIVK